MQRKKLRRTSLLHCNFPCNRLVSVQTGLKVQMAAADLLPNESHATANVSLLARLQKLSTVTLNLSLSASICPALSDEF